MKHTILLLIITILAGCSTDITSKTINLAEKLLNKGKIDSALTVLNDIYEPQKLNAPQQARYALVSATCHLYKGLALTEDSLLPSALDYYRNATPCDSARLMQATILASRYHWWKGDKNEAYAVLENYAGKCNKSDQIKMLFVIAALASDDYDYDKMYRTLSQLLRLYEPNDDRTYITRYNYGLASFYMGNETETKEILNDIDRYIKTQNDSIHYRKEGLRTVADIFADYGELHRAIELQNKALRNYAPGDSTGKSLSYASLSRYSLQLGNTAEAKRYMQLADDYATDEIRQDLSFVGLYKIMHILLDYTDSRKIDLINWADFVNKLQDNEKNNQSIASAKNEANNRLAEQNYKITITSQRHQIITLYVILSLVVLIILLAAYTWRKRKIAAEKDDELETLRQMISASQSQSSEKDDRFFKKILLQQLGIIRMAAANPTAANQELLKRMQQIADKEVAVDSLLNWDDLYKTIDLTYNGYHSRLTAKYGNVLNEKEMQLCCLLRANFSTKEISIVTQQSVRTVYQRKTVIRQKLGLEEGGDIAAAV